MFNGGNADYTVDMVGFLGLEMDNTEDVVLTLQDYVGLSSMFFSKTPNKWQRPMLEMLYDWLGLGVPDVQKNYEKTWQQLIDSCPQIATRISADLDEYFQQQDEQPRLVITRPGDLEQTQKDMDEHFLRLEKAIRERNRF